MSAKTAKPNEAPPAPRWRLWIDGCGGFLLLAGNHWSVGGLSHETSSDICVRADWPRRAGTIQRDGDDYFWQGPRSSDDRSLIVSEQPLPIAGSALVKLSQPSPLCNTAVLQLNPPHRFHEHVDGVILVSETLLVGPQSDCHIRCSEYPDRAVLTRRGTRWLAKTGLSSEFEEIFPGKRKRLRSLAMTLEEA